MTTPVTTVNSHFSSPAFSKDFVNRDEAVHASALQQLKFYSDKHQSPGYFFYQKARNDQVFKHFCFCLGVMNLSLGWTIGAEFETMNHTGRYSATMTGIATGAIVGLLSIVLFSYIQYRQWKDLDQKQQEWEILNSVMASSPLNEDPELHCLIRRELPLDPYYYVHFPKQIYDYSMLKEWVGAHATNPLGLQRAWMSDYKPCLVIKCLLADELGRILATDTDFQSDEVKKFPIYDKVYALHEKMLREIHGLLEELQEKTLGEPKEINEKYADRLNFFLHSLHSSF
jgi:hypothetical protein